MRVSAVAPPFKLSFRGTKQAGPDARPSPVHPNEELLDLVNCQHREAKEIPKVVHAHDRTTRCFLQSSANAHLEGRRVAMAEDIGAYQMSVRLVVRIVPKTRDRVGLVEPCAPTRQGYGLEDGVDGTVLAGRYR